jgi:ribosomal protein L29
MAGNKVNVKELRSKPKSELLETLGDLKKELLSLRVQSINAGSTGKATKMYVLQ